MSTLDRLDAAIESARQRGYRVRCEYMGGVTGGSCEVAGVRWIFIDLALLPDEQLRVVRDALESAMPECDIAGRDPQPPPSV